MIKFDKPILWFTQPLKSHPQPWRFFEIDGLMLNAYEILHNNIANKIVREKGIHGYIGFNGLIMIDSGGFLFMRKGMIDIKAEAVTELYEESKPNLGVVLDYPLVPNLQFEEQETRISRTLENTKLMITLKRSSNPELVPVIHGYDIDFIVRYIEKLHKIQEFNVYGIGSLVPFIFNSKGAGGIYNAVKIVSFVRRLLPNKIIHVFGVGSTITMHLMFYAGADSIDSSAWRSKATFGAIQLPEIGDRYITPVRRHKIYPTLTKKEEKILDKCKCPACAKEGLDGLKKSFTLRALHNAWVHQNEIEKIRKLIKNNEYEIYVKHVISKTRFSKILKYLKI